LLLAIFTMLPFLDPVMERYLTAINKHAILAKLYPISALINLVASILLVNEFGIVGVALGSIIPLCILVPVYLVYSCRQLGISPYNYVKMALFPLFLPNFFLGVGVLFLTQKVAIETYLQLFFVSFISLSSYVCLCWVLLLNNKEKHLVRVAIYTKLKA